MSVKKLKTEINNDPLGRGYAEMTDEEVALDLLSPYRSKKRSLSMKEFREWAGEGTRAFKIYQAIDDNTKSDQVRNACLVVDRLLGTDDGSLEPGNPAHVAMINGLVSADIITTQDREALVAVATDVISRADELGLGNVKVGHVQMARS